jgi:hypothetical protein
LLKQGSNDFQLGRVIHRWKDVFKGYKIVPLYDPKSCYEKDMNVQNFKTPKVPILGLPFGSLGKKCHLDVAPAESHKMYYREGVVPPFKGCRLFKGYA